MIRFEGVSKSFGGQQVLRDISFDIRSGECVGIIGASGVGKTTILRLITGAIAPDAGTVQVTESRVGYVFQEPRLLPWRTALDNIALGLRAEGYSKKAARLTAGQWITRLGLDGFAQHYPAQLSGGMRQRVSIGRALAIEPELLIMDEPFSHLDVELKDSLLLMTRELIDEHHPTVVYVTHDLVEAFRLADRVLRLTSASRLDELNVQEREEIVQALSRGRELISRHVSGPEEGGA